MPSSLVNVRHSCLHVPLLYNRCKPKFCRYNFEDENFTGDHAQLTTKTTKITFLEICTYTVTGCTSKDTHVATYNPNRAFLVQPTVNLNRPSPVQPTYNQAFPVSIDIPTEQSFSYMELTEAKINFQNKVATV